MSIQVKVLLTFIIAVLIAGVLGSIFQTQINLAHLRDIGPPVNFMSRLDSTWHDLTHFAPIYSAIILATFSIAIPLAEFIARKIPGHRMFWLVLAASSGLWVVFQLINYLAPMPTFIAATRTLGGTLLLLLAAAIGAVFYTLRTPHLNFPADEEESA